MALKRILFCLAILGLLQVRPATATPGDGRALASRIYFLNVRAGGSSAVRRVVVVR